MLPLIATWSKPLKVYAGDRSVRAGRVNPPIAPSVAFYGMSAGVPAPQDHAVRLLGAVEAGQSIDYLRMFVYPKLNYNAMVAELHARLDPTEMEQDWAEGRAMPIEQAAAYALEYPFYLL